jgi:SAM-dependent methyltransferase
VSATGRSDVRDPDDFYATPSWCIDAILPHLPSGGRVLDPGCGSGAILRAIMATAPFVHADLFGVEMHEGRAEEARALFADARKHHIETRDFLTYEGTSFDLVVGNPPFSLAMDFVERSLTLTKPFRGTVAMLLRMNWLASQKRAAFHRANPSDIYVLPRRPSFTPDGKTDSTEYAWFVWGPSRGNRWVIL